MEQINEIIKHYTPINTKCILKKYNFYNAMKIIIPMVLIISAFILIFTPFITLFILPLIFICVTTSAPSFINETNRNFWSDDLFDMIYLKTENNQVILYTRTTLLNSDLSLRKMIISEVKRLFKSENENAAAIDAYEYYSKNQKYIDVLPQTSQQILLDRVTVKRINFSELSDFMRNYIKIQNAQREGEI